MHPTIETLKEYIFKSNDFLNNSCSAMNMWGQKARKLQRTIYLDWVNNFISVDGFADHYRIDKEYAELLIKQGREAHEHYVKYGIKEE